MTSRGRHIVELDVELLRVTDAAVLLRSEHDEEGWFPLSQIEIGADISRQGPRQEFTNISVPEWIAIEKGFL